QLLRRFISSHHRITVCAAREGIGLPVVSKSSFELLTQLGLADAQDASQGLQGVVNHLFTIHAKKFLGVSSRGPAGQDGEWQWMAGPPGWELLIISECKAQVFEASLPEFFFEAQAGAHHWTHLQSSKSFLFLRQP